MGKKPRLIKRYANRKLYDSSQSRYVTLQEVEQMVRDGIDLEIIDNKTKEDITARTLAQFVMENEKRKDGALPLSTLKQLVQSGGELLSRTVAKPVSNLREEAERTVANIREDVEKNVNKLWVREKEGAEALRQSAKDWMEGAQARLDEAHHHMDEKLSEMMTAIPIVLSNRVELNELRARVQTLEKALEDEREK
jgi:polyhydroxyalkanoate synthesis repressor PhaR